MKAILSLDLGTTSCRAIFFDHAGNSLVCAQKEFTQYYPKPGWVEHNAEEIFDTTVTVAREAIEKMGIAIEDIVSIGVTNQRETTVLWDRTNGKPIAPAIVWQCRRTAPIIDALVREGWSDTIRSKTGLIPDAYFSGSKIRWLLDEVPGAKEKAEKGDILFGTIETWVIWKLTCGKAHVTDMTNASRTMIFNIHELCWDRELLSLLHIPEQILPKVMPSSCRYGETEPCFFGKAIPISGAAGDQQSALFGQCCFNPGEMKNTYGTGCFLLMNTGKTAVESQNGLLTTIAAGFPDHVEYALEGSVFVAGASIQWLRDELKVILSAKESEELACSVENTADGYVVPAFTGLGAPYWNQNARGVIVGLTRGFSKAHLVRATLDSLAYQTYDIAKCMEADAGIRICSLKVDGGACANNYLMQFQSDLLGCETIRPENIETTALGAAYLAGLAEGFWNSREDISQNWAVDKVFHRKMKEDKVEKLLKGWKRAVRCAIRWADDE